MTTAAVLGASNRRVISNLTAGGVPIPSGWALQRLDTFGTANSVPGPIRLHTLYNEAIFFDQDGTDRIQIPNTGINSQQQIYQHFEDATWLFMSDRLRIQARGQGDNSIKSGQMETNGFGRSFIFEARLTAPATLGSWVEYWVFADSAGGTTSEIDVEIVISNPAGSGSNLDTHSYSIGNIGDSGQVITIDDSHVTVDVPSGSGLVLYRNAALNVSTGPHYYTTIYDDSGPGQIRRYLDGVLLYHATWKWNTTMGGTGFGPDPAMILDLAVGGAFPGNVATPSAYSGDLDVYSLGFYTPALVGRAVPAAQAWSFKQKASAISLSSGDLVATGTVTADSIVYALDGMYTGKYYWEVILSNNNGSAGVGCHDNFRTDTYLGDFGAGVGWYGSGRGTDAGIWANGANIAAWEVYSATPARLCFALHVVVGVSCKLWGRVGAAGNWNNDVIGNQNPATDLGGLALPFTAARFVAIRPAADIATPGDTATMVAASGSWVGTPPAGFGQIGPT